MYLQKMKVHQKLNKLQSKNDKGRLTEEEINRMVEEAKQFEEEDKKLKERIDSKNNLETFSHSIKSQLNDDKKNWRKNYFWR